MDRRAAAAGVAPDSRRSSVADPRQAAGKTRAVPDTRRSSVGTLPSNDRVGMLLVEANEISRYLQTDYIFKKADESLSEDTATFIKVVNSKYNSSCLWPLSKLKEKLIKMRKLVYTENCENQGPLADSILFDGTESWLPESSSADNRSFFVESVSSPRLDSAERKASKDWFVCQARVATAPSADDGVETLPPMNSALTSSSLLLELDELVADTHLMYLPHFPNDGGQNGDDYSSGIYSFGTDHSTAVTSPHQKPTSLPAAPRIKEPLRIDRQFRQSSASRSQRTNQPKPVLAVDTSPRHVVEMCTSSSQTDDRMKSSVTTETQTTTGDQRQPSLTMSSCSTQTDVVDGEGSRCKRFGGDGNGMEVNRMCKDLITMLLTRLSGNSNRQGSGHMIDNLLRLIEGTSQSLRTLVKASTSVPAGDMHAANGGIRRDYQVNIVSVQLVLAVELMVAIVNLSCGQIPTGHIVTAKVIESHRSMSQLIKEIAKDFEVFWQAQDSNSRVEVLVVESSTKIFALLSDLLTELGKLSVMLGVCPEALSDNRQTSLEQLLLQRSARADDMIGLEPQIEVKRSFLSGCDIMVDKTLYECQCAIEDNESLLQTSNDPFFTACSNSVKQELSRLISIVSSNSRAFFSQLQKIQVVLNSTLKEQNDSPANFYHLYVKRCISVVDGAQKLADSVTLLIRATEHCDAEIDCDTLRKIARCSEMVQRCVSRMSKPQRVGSSCSVRQMSVDLLSLESKSSTLSTTAGSSTVTSSNLSSYECADIVAILSSEQNDIVRQAVGSVCRSTADLCDMVRSKLSQVDVRASASTETDSNSAPKRMLPIVPGSSIGGSLVNIAARCQSARNSDSSQSTAVLSNHISMIGFTPQRSNEI